MGCRSCAERARLARQKRLDYQKNKNVNAVDENGNKIANPASAIRYSNSPIRYVTPKSPD